MKNSRKADDILISICFPDFLIDENNEKFLFNIIKRIDTIYRYVEVVIVIDASKSHSYEHLIKSIKNLRLILVQKNLQYHRRRVVAAAEAIGDIIVLASINELAVLNLSLMIESAKEKGGIAIGVQSKNSILNPVIKTLGFTSGYNVDMRNLSTAVYPRTILNQLLYHSNRQLALRFPPRDMRIPLIKHFSSKLVARSKSKFDWMKRIDYIQKLFIDSAPNILLFISGLSVLVCITALTYGVYAVIAWLTIENIQPGWLTTSLVLSLTTSFLGISILGISLGVHNILEKLSPNELEDVVGEISEADLFSQVKQDLNVEVYEN